MSLLTKEQQDDVNTIKNYVLSSLPVHNDQSHDYRMLRHMCMRLIPIIDDLHARAPRQYTEQELREWFENRPLVQDEIDALLHEVVPGENEAWYSVLKFAAHVGALKAEP